MDFLTLRDIQESGSMLEVECVRCGSIDQHSPGEFLQSPETAIGALGLDLECRRCGARACIISAAVNPDVAPESLAS